MKKIETPENMMHGQHEKASIDDKRNVYTANIEINNNYEKRKFENNMKKTLIYKDKESIKEILNNANSLVNTLNENYKKIKSLDKAYSYRIVIHATFFNSYKNDLKERNELCQLIANELKISNKFTPKDVILDYIKKELLQKLFYNERDADQNTAYYFELQQKNLQTLQSNSTVDKILKYVEFDDNKDLFKVNDSFKNDIEDENTFYTQNERQEKVLKALFEIQNILSYNKMTSKDIDYLFNQSLIPQHYYKLNFLST